MSASAKISRRTLIVGMTGAAVLLGFGAVSKYALANEKQTLRPPGGQDDEHLIATCIRCDRCRQICPMKAIESAGVEDGVLNIRTPKMNFRTSPIQRTLGTNEYKDATTGYCNFCDPELLGGQTKKCIACCPTGALKDFDETSQSIGLAKIDPVYCINYPQMGQTPTGCRLCVDACPYEAIVMDDEQHLEVIAQRCNGCGKCEQVCPSSTYRHFIGVETLRERASSGIAQYAESLEYYERFGKIARGINIHLHDVGIRA
jgi:ferredoxin-type protein NapG